MPESQSTNVLCFNYRYKNFFSFSNQLIMHNYTSVIPVSPRLNESSEVVMWRSNNFYAGTGLYRICWTS